MKIKEIFEGKIANFAKGFAQGILPKQLQDIQFGKPKATGPYKTADELYGTYVDPDVLAAAQQAAQQAAPQPPRRIPQQIEVGNNTLTRMPGGDWYDMATNTLITDPNIIARADKRWTIQQQNLQMAPGYQPMSGNQITGFNRRKGAGRRGTKT